MSGESLSWPEVPQLSLQGILQFPEYLQISSSRPHRNYVEQSSIRPEGILQILLSLAGVQSLHSWGSTSHQTDERSYGMSQTILPYRLPGTKGSATRLGHLGSPSPGVSVYHECNGSFSESQQDSYQLDGHFWSLAHMIVQG